MTLSVTERANKASRCLVTLPRPERNNIPFLLAIGLLVSGNSFSCLNASIQCSAKENKILFCTFPCKVGVLSFLLKEVDTLTFHDLLNDKSNSELWY